MSVLLLRWRGWWARFLGRSKPAHVPAHFPVAETPRPAEAVSPAEIPAAPHAPARLEKAEAEGHGAQSLLEIIQAKSLDAVKTGPRPLDPKVRERTLAALDNLRQIPALQSLAQGFLRAMNRSEVAVEEVVAAVEKDSALCVRILKMA